MILYEFPTSPRRYFRSSKLEARDFRCYPSAGNSKRSADRKFYLPRKEELRAEQLCALRWIRGSSWKIGRKLSVHIMSSLKAWWPSMARRLTDRLTDVNRKIDSFSVSFSIGESKTWLVRTCIPSRVNSSLEHFRKREKISSTTLVLLTFSTSDISRSKKDIIKITVATRLYSFGKGTSRT